MAQVELITARIAMINGNVRLLLALLVGWAIVFWWLSLSFLVSFTIAAGALRTTGRGVSETWVVPIAMALVGFVTSYVGAVVVLAIGRQVDEMRSLAKALADGADGLPAGTAERSLFLKPMWPMQAIAWPLGLHAVGAALMAVVWLLLAWQEMR